MKCASHDFVHYKYIKACWKLDRAKAPPQSEGRWDLIHSGCFWNTISRSNICQRMMHDSPVWHHSCCHSPVYSKARRSTVVQINFTITPPPPSAQLETKYRQLGSGVGAGALLSPPAVWSKNCWLIRDVVSVLMCDFSPGQGLLGFNKPKLCGKVDFVIIFW